jgi:AraC-like DNA-binding protein
MHARRFARLLICAAAAYVRTSMPNPVLMTLIDASLRGTLVALLLLLAYTLARDRPRLAAARTGTALAVGLCVQVLGSSPFLEAQVPWPWQVPLIAVSVGNSVLFWVFVQAMFDDEFSPRPLHAAAWFAVAALSALNCVVLGRGWALAPVALGVQRAVPLLFGGLAAAAAASHFRSDLVEGRRWLRGFVVFSGVGYTLATALARLSSAHGRLSSGMATLDIALLLAIVAVVAARMLRWRETDLFPAAGIVRSPIAHSPPEPGAVSGCEPRHQELTVQTTSELPAHAADERLVAALHRVMSQERAYRTEDLTVASLAARLSVPEYRLRRSINQRLGHRNFNAYVNGFRLADARASLADPAKRELPILTIALDAGFQSIGPFNRAFKAATGLTPSDFRREKLADS